MMHSGPYLSLIEMLWWELKKVVNQPKKIQLNKGQNSSTIMQETDQVRQKTTTESKAPEGGHTSCCGKQTVFFPHSVSILTSFSFDDDGMEFVES